MSELRMRPPSLVSALVLYVLASPILLLKAIGMLFDSYRAARLIRAGFLRCPFCGRGNRLDALIACSRCGFAQFRSLALPCDECGYVPSFIYCTGCGASLRLP